MRGLAQDGDSMLVAKGDGASSAVSGAATAAPSISAFIITRNEACNIARCLASLDFSNDIVVLDSGSTDDTTAIARRHPHVRLFERCFDDYASQRNFGLHQIRYANPWVLVIDADEVVDRRLRDTILARIGSNDPALAATSAFMVRRFTCLDGQVLRRNLSAHFWIARLVRPDRVAYEGSVHERLIVDGGVERLPGVLLHYQFAQGIDHWLARRMRYAALERIERAAGNEPVPPLAKLWHGTHFERRALLKMLFKRLPARRLIYWIVSVVITWPFLEGRAGMRYLYLETLSQFRAARPTKEDLPCSAMPAT